MWLSMRLEKGSFVKALIKQSTETCVSYYNPHKKELH